MANTPKTIVDVVGAVKNYTDKNYISRQLLKDTVGWTGKNLLKNGGKNTTSAGITTTINADKSITLNGTATLSDNQCFLYGTSWGNYVPINESPFEVGKTYILSKGSSNQTARLIFYFFNGNTYITDAKCIQENVKFTIPQNTTHLACVARVDNGATVSNLTFYPMIRRADIVDDTYEPYHESVETMYEEEIHGVNLLTLKSFANAVAGLTATLNSDNSITINGTSTNSNNIYLSSRSSSDANILNEGDYVLSVGTIPSTCRLHASYSATDGTNVIVAYGEYGKGDLLFTAPVSGRPWNITLQVNDNATLNNLKIYPMLRKATIEDSTYRPYNPQAIQNQLNAQGVLGAKNRLYIAPSIVTTTHRGVTWTVTRNSKGEVTEIDANGTATGGNSFFDIATSAGMNDAGNYILSGCPSGGSNSTYRINFYNQTKASYLYETGDGVDVQLNGTDTWVVSPSILNGYTANHVKFYPMLRLASDPDDTYVPYAMTNRELTEKVGSELSTTGLTYTNCEYVAGGYVVSGNICTINIRVKATADSGISINGIPNAKISNNSNYISAIMHKVGGAISDTISGYCTSDGLLSAFKNAVNGADYLVSASYLVR